MIQLVISFTIIEQVSLETACIHSKFHLVETTFPLSTARCAWHESRQKKRGGRYDKYSLPPVLSFLLPQRRFTALQFQLLGVLWDLGSSPAVGSAIGLLVGLQQKRPARCIAFLLRDGTGCNTEVVVPLPWYSVMPPKASQAKLIAQLALPWLAVICFSSYRTSTTHRGSLHLLLASPVTLKATRPHAGSPCHGNCLASGFER